MNDTISKMNLNAYTDQDLLITQAIHKFVATTGVQIAIDTQENQVELDEGINALVNIKANAKIHTYAIEVAHHLTKAKLALAMEHLRNTPHKGMLVTDYVNPKMAERLKEINLAFIDLAGNAYLNEPPIFIYIMGNRPTKTNLGRNLKPNRAFQATGLKVLFGLLTEPDLIHGTYRNIALVTDVALGTVGGVLADLKEHGYLYEGKGHKRKLTQKTRIIEQWVTAYPDKLRPKLHLGRYRAPAQGWWRDVQLETQNTQWGGEVAAAKLTGYLKPDTTIIYANVIPARLLAKNRLKTDPDGDVEILKRFWKTDKNPNAARTTAALDVVPPLLVYADLMATADDRNIETAKIIYDQHLDGHLRQDR
jgi:hypothetical protein